MNKKIISVILSAAFIVFAHYHISIVISSDQTQEFKLPKPIEPVFRTNKQIWISMGLCFDNKTELYNKAHYPYAEVTPMAIKLWKHFREVAI